MKKLLILTLMLFVAKSSFAQRMRVTEHYSLGYGFDKKTAVPSIMYNQKLLIGKKVSFAVGTGFRLSSLFISGKTYEGIDKKNARVFLTPQPRANITTFNIPLVLELQSRKLLFGANFDLIGMALGKRRDSVSVRNTSGQTLTLDSLSMGVPTLNLGFAGRGTTNNEIYIGFRPQEELTIKVGLSLVFSQYNARYRRNNKDVDFGRFRYDAPVMPFVSIVFNFER